MVERHNQVPIGPTVDAARRLVANTQIPVPNDVVVGRVDEVPLVA